MTLSKTRGLLAVIVLASALAGCGAEDKPTVKTGTNSSELPTATVEPSPVVHEVEASIYLTDAELLETIEKKVKLPYETDLGLVKAALTELQKNGGENELSLWTAINILSVDLTDGLVEMNIHLSDEAHLGAPGEALIIETLQRTLFQFEFVQAIDVLVDGEAVESLMGHLDLEHPMKKA